MSTVATAIRDAIVSRLDPAPALLAAWGIVRRVQLPQLQPDKLPALAVFIAGERMQPDGDANAGEPSFLSATTIAISVTRGFQDPAALDGSMDADVDVIEETLLCDPSFVAPALFESVESISRTRRYPQDGETYFSELRLEMTFVSRVSYPPMIPDHLGHVHITTRQIGEEMHTPALVTEIDLPT